MASKLTLPGGRDLAYNLSPNPANGPVVLLANSLTSDHTSWDHFVERLVARGFRPLRFDQPGHGGSGVPADLSSTTFASMAGDVAALLAHLGLARIHAWVGVSMGAAMSMYFLDRHPGVVDRVVVCDTISASPVNAGVPDAFGDRVAAARREGSLDAVRVGTLERWFGREWLDANPEEAVRMDELMKTTTLDGFETCCAALRSETFDLEPLLDKVAAGCENALLVVGEKDADLPTKMEDMRAKIEKGFQDAGKSRNVELRVIKNAGHVCFIDNLQSFCEIVIPFLEE